MHDRHAWHQMADLLSDAVLNAMWWLYGGLIAFGSCWWMGYGGYRAWQEWDRDRLQRREERRAHRLEDDVARGLREVELFLQDQCPSNGGHAEKASKAPRTHRWRPYRGESPRA